MFLSEATQGQTCLSAAASVWPKILNCPSNNYTSLADSDVGAKGASGRGPHHVARFICRKSCQGSFTSDVHKFLGFLDPLPIITVAFTQPINVPILLVSFGLPPSTLSEDVICDCPLRQTRVSFDGAIGSKINGSFCDELAVQLHCTLKYFKLQLILSHIPTPKSRQKLHIKEAQCRVSE